MEERNLILAIIIGTFLFGGSPDVTDALIHFLMSFE